MSHNITYIAANKVYGSSTIENRLIRTIANLLHTEECPLETGQSSTRMIIEVFDACYLEHKLPLHTISDELTLSAETLARGSSQPVEVRDKVVILFGARELKSRLFVFSEEVDLWKVSVHGKHDAPAPVILEVWIDDNFVDSLVFDKGDDSWETLSVSTMVTPGFHQLFLRYVNDFYDRELGLDRNAYIGYAFITRQ
ncbi:MAG: hypothetical protein IPG51_07190 [Chloroflexi bacterium]|nr:hypothetical protein [Chloroflexota bacterium]